MRLPSSWIASTRDLKGLLRKHIRPEMRVLEIGFAPGKLLSFVSKILDAKVAGLDYSESGVQFARNLFGTLGIAGDLRCENVFTTTFLYATFDFVYSVGVIEHFDDPGQIVRCHVELLKPGGTALVLIPNYGGIYGHLQRWFDPRNLDIHNLHIMNCEALARLSPRDIVKETMTFRTGSINPWLVHFHKKWPPMVAKVTCLILNGVALLQPLSIPQLCPMIALQMVRADS